MRIIVSMKPGTWIDPPKFAKQIEAAGYGARKDEIRITVVATVVRTDSGTILEVGSSTPPVRLLASSSAIADTALATRAEQTLKQLGGMVGARLEVEGIWRPAQKSEGTLALQRLAPLSFKTAPNKEPTKAGS